MFELADSRELASCSFVCAQGVPQTSKSDFPRGVTGSGYCGAQWGLQRGSVKVYERSYNAIDCGEAGACDQDDDDDDDSDGMECDGVAFHLRL